MKKTKIIYWILTGLMALFIVPGAIMNMLSTAQSAEIFTHIGFPLYTMPFLGAAKILGVVAILIPGYPRIKEWAYAGLFYDLLGAAYAGYSSGDGIKSLPIIIGMTIVLGSYAYHHKLLKEPSAGNG